VPEDVDEEINVEKPTILKLRRRKTLSPWALFLSVKSERLKT
jgi:hypothetical protein